MVKSIFKIALAKPAQEQREAYSAINIIGTYRHSH